MSEETKRKLRLIRKKGRDSSSWKGDDATVGAGRMRARKLYPNPKPCEYCNNPKAERHHKDGNTLNNKPDNVVWRCRRCHMIEDGRMKKVLNNLKQYQERRSE